MQALNFVILLLCIKFRGYQIVNVELKSLIFCSSQLSVNNGEIFKSAKGASRDFMRILTSLVLLGIYSKLHFFSIRIFLFFTSEYKPINCQKDDRGQG